jgi:hypothetical protein
MQDVSDKLLDRFVECLTEKLTAEPEVEADEPVAPAQPPPAQPPPATARTEAPASQVALDLGSTLLPVLAKRYGPPAFGLLVIVLALRRLLRR